MESFVSAFDTVVDDPLFWLTDHAAFVFDAVRAVLEGLYDAVLWLLMLPPFWAVAVLVGLIGWRALSWGFSIGSAIALATCAAIGLWEETMQTPALVVAASVIALAISIPRGVLAGLMPRLDRALTPAFDLIQTLPPYIYLLPAITLMGFGPATALVATVIVAPPPAIRLTSLGIRQTPSKFLELGQAVGASRGQMFWKIRLPFAMALGMVVIAASSDRGACAWRSWQPFARASAGSPVCGRLPCRPSLWWSWPWPSGWP